MVTTMPVTMAMKEKTHGLSLSYWELVEAEQQRVEVQSCL